LKRNNVQRVLTLLKANYPQSFSKLTPEMGEILLATWEVALSTYDDNAVNAAVIAWICTKNSAFAPTVGQLVSSIQTMPIYMYQQVYPSLFVGDTAIPIGTANAVSSLTGNDSSVKAIENN